MDIPKSHSRFCLELVSRLVEDVYQQTPSVNSPRELKKDLETLRSRVSKEGLSFLTKTLPKLGKALDLGLETGRIAIPREFPRGRNDSVPLFCRRLFRCVFDADGFLLPNADPYVLKDLRQVLFIFYKIEVPYSSSQERSVVEAFVDNEERLRSFQLPDDEPTIARATQFITGLFAHFDHRAIEPGHGPGAVAGKQKAHEKRMFSTKFELLHEVYPYYEYFFNRGPDILSRLSQYRGMKTSSDPTARVCLVPKDSRGPRLISCEPLEIQFIQQGLMKALYEHIESHPCTRGLVNFRDQGVNQSLALKGSIDRSYSTADLKDASDLVSMDLVRRLFSGVPHLLRALEATRSTQTELPDGTIVRMRKFAPMGSALCFPIEALCFFAIIRAELQLTTGYRRGDLFVYGDDIILRKHCYGAVFALERYGLLVNRGKSFDEGFFRESCGTDAFRGHDVTPLKVRKLVCTAGRVQGVLAEVEYANRLYDQCYYKASAFLKANVEKVLRRRLPYSATPDISYLAWVVPRISLPYIHKGRWNKKLHRWETRQYVPKGTSYEAAGTEFSEAAELFRKITDGWSEEFRAHVYARRGRNTLHLKWVPTR